MPLARDKFTGWKTEADPHPAQGLPPGGRLTGWKNPAPAKRENGEQDPELQRRLDQAGEKKRERQHQGAVLKQLYQVFEVLPLARIPGTGLLSRTCKQLKCHRHHFESYPEFIKHVVEHHGNDERDARWEAAMKELADQGIPVQ